MELIEFAALTPKQRAELEGDEADPWGADAIQLTFGPWAPRSGRR